MDMNSYQEFYANRFCGDNQANEKIKEKISVEDALQQKEETVHYFSLIFIQPLRKTVDKIIAAPT
jgi:hypothetical protein